MALTKLGVVAVAVCSLALVESIALGGALLDFWTIAPIVQRGDPISEEVFARLRTIKEMASRDADGENDPFAVVMNLQIGLLEDSLPETMPKTEQEKLIAGLDTFILASTAILEPPRHQRHRALSHRVMPLRSTEMEKVQNAMRRLTQAAAVGRR